MQQASWMVTFFGVDAAQVGVPKNTNRMSFTCLLQSHDNLVLDGQPATQQLTAANTITHF